LQAEGITTVAFHSNPYLCDYLGWNRGWDVFYDSMEDEVGTSVPYIRGDVINKKVAEWLDIHSHTRAKPFFLWVHYMDVHEPYVPEPTHIERAGLSIDMTEDEMLALFQDVLRKRDVSDPESVRLLRELYYAHVREADGYVEELLSCLETTGLIDETVLILTSDHGDEFGEHGGLSHDDKMYSELLDVPLFIYGADDPARYDRLVSTVDIAPTILSLFDLGAVPQFQGTKLIPLDSSRDMEAFSEAIDMR
jgi:arylsulfatase A-like enzyme